MSGFDLSGFLASFFDEARQRLSSINANLVRFEAGNLSEEGLIELRRDAHTIKGSALMLGVQDVGDAAHLFEDAMAWLIEHPERRTPEVTQFLFDLHDALVARVQDHESSEPIDLEPFRTRFQALQSGSPEPAGGSQDATAKEEAEEPPLEANLEALADAMREEPELEREVSIGLEEARAWQERKQAEQAGAEGDVEEVGPRGTEDESAEETLREELREGETHAEIEAHASLLDEPDNFRPDVREIEMRTSARRQSSGRFVRVDAERLERLSGQVIELSTEKSRGETMEKAVARMHLNLRMLHRNWRNFITHAERWPEHERQKALAELMDAFERQLFESRRLREEVRSSNARTAMMLDELRDQVLRLMVRPLDSVFSTFPRAVRDAAVRSGKKVQLLIGGESVELDQAVAEALVEPLVHLLNNAVIHGIEPPEVRRSLGKPEEGQVTILARQSGSEIRIEVIDDGAGIDVERVRRRAVELGVTTEVEAEAMDSAEVLEMIFRPGFTTAADVTERAGRGIGMNVVQDTIRKLTGTIRVYTKPGKGTRFSIQLPVSIAVQSAMIFRIGGMRFGMLTHMTEQAIPLREFEIETGPGNKPYVRYRRHLVPLVDLRKLLLKSDSEPLSANPYVLIAEHIEGFVGILVDELYDEAEIVVRDLDPYLKRYQTPGLMGNTITGDGSVLLLIEPYGFKEMGRTAPNIDLDEIRETAAAPAPLLRALLVEDSIIAREVEKGMLEANGFSVETAIDGLDALDKMKLSRFDIVITDLEMPRLDGFGLVQRLRGNPRFEDLPILVISTRESPEDRMRAIEAGADGYLVKQQLSPAGLRETLEGLLGSLDSGKQCGKGIDAGHQSQ